MRRHSRLRLAYLVLLIAPCLMARPAPLAAQDNCAEWTEWDAVGSYPLLWGWRWCQTTSERYDVQWRFANTDTEPIEFRYEFYTGIVSQCGDQNRGRLFARGKYRMDAGQQDEHRSGRKSLSTTGFEERFWLYLCVLPVEQASTVRTDEER